MGIQSWRRGVHTGNTIRAGGSSAQKRYQAIESGLVKRQVLPPSTVTAPFLEQPEEERKRVRRRGGRAKKATYEEKRFVEVEELEELEENVFYSLNKKGRWNLPEMIQTEIKNSKCTQKGQTDRRDRRCAADDRSKLDQDLTMVQCHPLKGGSNCFAVSSTKLPGDGTVSKTKNYLNVNSVLQKKTKQKLRPNKKRKSATPQVEKAEEKPTTEIEISSPYPRNSYMKYAEKSRHSLPIHKDTKQQSPSRHFSSSDKFYEMPTTIADAYSDTKCFDARDWATDGDASRPEPTKHQPSSIDRKAGDVTKAKSVPEPEEDAYVWFLGEFVQMPNSECQDDTAEDEALEKEENPNNEIAPNKVVSDSSIEIPSEESEDWEFLENEAPPEGDEFHENGDDGILSMLIEDALVRKAAGLTIAQQVDTRKKRRTRNIQH